MKALRAGAYSLLKWILLILGGVWTSYGAAHGEVLFAFTAHSAGGGRIVSTDLRTPVTWYNASQTPTFRLFNVPWTTNDVGLTLTATAATDANFNSVVALMTDGVPEPIEFDAFQTWDGGGGWNSYDEPFVFYGSDSDPRIDLHGYQIDAISLRLDSLTLTSPGSNPNRDGNWTDYSASVTLTATGEAIPEPTTISLVFLGAITLIGCTRSGGCDL